VYNFEVIEDAVSYGKSKKIYAKAGELVKVVADHNPVAICEKKNGERFSTLFTNLKQKS
jgi:aspartate 1-decarboxylase